MEHNTSWKSVMAAQSVECFPCQPHAKVASAIARKCWRSDRMRVESISKTIACVIPMRMRDHAFWTK